MTSVSVYYIIYKNNANFAQIHISEVYKLRSRRFFLGTVAVLTALILAFSSVAGAVVLTFETQFEYDRAELGWLTDLIIKEDMTTPAGLAGRVDLTPVPTYPYTETADSFKNEVNEYVSLYSLKESGLRASYIYLFELLGSNADLFAAQISDSAVRNYLENVGVTYSATADSDILVLAKALYSAMITGAFTGVSEQDLRKGVSLEKALVKYVSSLSGLTSDDVARFAPDEADSLSEYILAASRYTLWANGYDVDETTPEDEVSKLMAVMTVRTLGISVDPSESFSALKAKYTAALLGTKYNVTVNPDRLSSAIENRTAPFYILQLIGQKYSLSVREDGISFSEAFDLVAENTHIFDFETDEFYADVYDYEINLAAPRSSLWVYPTSYAGSDSAAIVSITVNGKAVQDNFFTEVPLDSQKAEQELVIRVEAARYGDLDVKTYTVKVYSPVSASIPAVSAPGTTESEYQNADTIVSEILRSVGVNEGVIKATDNLINALPVSLRSAMDFISPTFGENLNIDGETSVIPTPRNTEISDSAFVSYLDKLGAVMNSSISGIDGLTLSENIESQLMDYNFITFD